MSFFDLTKGNIYIKKPNMFFNYELLFVLFLSCFISLQSISKTQVNFNFPEQTSIPTSSDLNTVSLSLSQAIEKAIQNNLDAKIQKNVTQINDLDFRIYKGVYAPTFGLNTFYENDQRPVTNIFGGSNNGKVTTESWEANSYLKGVLPFGTQYELNFFNTKSRTDNTFQFLVPQYESSLQFKVVQPLLKGFWMNDNRKNIKVLKINKEVSDLDFEKQLMNLVYKTEFGYWDLVLANQRVAIKNKSLSQSAEQLRRSIRLAEIGSSPKIETVTAEAELEKRKEELLVAEETLFRSQNSLKLLLANGLNSELWTKEISIQDNLQKVILDVSVEEALEKSIDKRPEFASLNKKFKINEIEKKYYINRGLPQLDLVGDYTLRGIAGSERAVQNIFGTGGNNNSIVLPRFVGGYGDNLSNLASNDYRTIRLGLNLSWPIAPATTKQVLQKVALEKEQINLEFSKNEQLVKTEIANAFNAIKSAEQRIAASEASVKAAEKQLIGETQKFKSGLSTNFFVLIRQNDLAEAELRMAEATADYNKAVAELYLAAGIILEKREVSLQK